MHVLFRRALTRPVVGAGIGVTLVATSVFAGAAVTLARSAEPTAPSATTANARVAVCEPGFTPSLASAGRGETTVSLPYALDYRAGSPSSPAGQGSNPSTIGYTVTVSSPDGKESVRYGTDSTDAGQGVPWASSDGAFGAGRVPAWALDASGAGEYRVTITYEKPVFGMRTAVTDLDYNGESMTLDAFAERTGGTAIPLTNTVLDSPTTIPELAPDRVHAGNTAYVVDGDVVAVDGENTYTNVRSAAISDSSASVFFAFDSDRPVQRIEMTYKPKSGAGFWFVPPSVPQACVQPNVSVSDVHQGGLATMTSTIANGPGNGRVEDVGYTYRLPEGVVVADDPKLAGGCGATITAEPGATEIIVAGAAVGSGDTSCEWSVDLQFTTGGPKTFDGSNIIDATNVHVPGTTPTIVDVETDEARAAVTMTAAVESGDEPGVGKSLVYTATVTNMGNAPLTTVTVVDELGTGIDCTGLPVAVGASATCVSRSPHPVTQVEVDAGRVRNGATVTASTAIGTVVSVGTGAVDTSITRRAVLTGTVEDTVVAAGEVPRAGDTIAYLARFTNDGTVTLSGLQVDGVAADCAPASLAPGQSTECVLASHEVSQADFDAGGVERSFVLTAAAADGSSPRVEAPVTTTLEIAPSVDLGSVSVLHTEDGERAEPGDTVVTTAEVTNTGNVTLTDVVLEVDRGTALACPSTLAPGEAAECSTTLTLTQKHIDAGRVTVEVSGAARSASGEPITMAPVKTTVALPFSAAAHVDVDAALITGADGRADVGDTVLTAVAVHNTGNVTLSDVSLTAPGGSALRCPTEIAPGDVVECETTLVLTQEMIDAGTVTVTVTGGAASPQGERVTFDRARATVEVPRAAAAAASVTASGSDEVHQAGDRVMLTATVQNRGNTTLVLTGLLLDSTDEIACDATLAPGASTDCTTEHLLSQEEIDSGAYTATVVGSLDAPGGNRVPVSADTAVVLPAAADATLDLPAAYDTGADGRIAAGDLIRVRPVMTNAGNVTLHDVTVRGLEGSTASCGDTLAPGASVECETVEHTLTQDDMDRRSVELRADGAARTPDGAEVVAAEQIVTIELPAEPSLRFTADAVVRSGDRVLSADEHGTVTVSPGDTVEWRNTVTNTGALTLSDLRTVSSPGSDSRCEQQVLEPGASTECRSARQVLTAADIATGSVTRTLHAEGATPPAAGADGSGASTIVTSEERTVTVEITAPPVAELAFTGADLAPAAALAVLLLGGGALLVVFRRRGLIGRR
jgi:uncharacterized repeat protein (TIGR01451 family)